MDMSAVPPKLKSGSDRELSLTVCPFTDKLRKRLNKSLISKYRDSNRMTQLM